MNGQSYGDGILSRRSIVAMFAVALMLISVAPVIISSESSNGEQNAIYLELTQDTTENDIKEKLGNKCGWTGTGNERTLTISGVNVTKSNSEGIAIEVAESIFLTIKVEGRATLLNPKTIQLCFVGQ